MNLQTRLLDRLSRSATKLRAPTDPSLSEAGIGEFSMFEGGSNSPASTAEDKFMLNLSNLTVKNESSNSPLLGVRIMQPEDIGSMICGGIIGKGRKVCGESERNCITNAHKSNRFALTEKCLVIGSDSAQDFAKNFGSNGWFYQSPVLPLRLIPAGKVEQVLSEQLDFESWAQFFTTVASMPNNLGVQKVVAFEDAQRTAKRVNLSYYTPAKKAVLKEEAALVHVLEDVRVSTNVDAKVQLLSADLSIPNSSAILEMWNETSNRFRSTHQNFELINNKRKLDELDVSESLKDVEDKIRAISAGIGLRSGIQAKLGVASLWEGVERAFEGGHSTGNDEVRQELEYLKNIATTSKQEFGMVRGNLLLLTNKVKQIDDEIMTSSSSGLASKIQAVEQCIEEILVPMYEKQFKELDARVTSVETTAPSLSHGGQEKSDFLNRLRTTAQGLNVPNNNTFQAGNSRNTHVLPSSTPTLEALANRVTMLEARIGNETISIGGFVFKSKEDVHEFIVNDFPSASWSCFYDVVSFLERLSHSYSTWDKEMEYQYRASQGGHDSREEGKIAASFGCVLPGLFRRDQGKLVDVTSDHPLPGLKHYKNWNNDSGSNCMRSQIMDHMDTQCSAVRTNIDIRFNAHDKTRQLATSFLNETQMFINDFFGTYIEELYRELLTTSAAPAKEAWLLVSTVIFEVFNFFYKVRSHAQDFDSLLTAQDKTATIIWASARCHHRMKELREARFRHHPLISTVLSNHLFKFRVPISVHKDLEKEFRDELKLLKKEKVELKSKVDAQVSKLAALESKVNAKWKAKTPP